MDSYGLWGNVASSSQALIVSTVPFWEIVLGICVAVFVLFLILSAFSKGLKGVLRFRK